MRHCIFPVIIVVSGILLAGCEYSGRRSSAYPLQYHPVRQFTPHVSSVYSVPGDSPEQDLVAVVAFEDIATFRESYIQLEDPESKATLRRFNITHPSNTTFLDTIPQLLGTIWPVEADPAVVYSLTTKDSLSLHLLTLKSWTHERLWSTPVPSGREVFAGVQPVDEVSGATQGWLSIQYQDGDFDYSQCMVDLNDRYDVLFDVPFGPALSFAGGSDFNGDGELDFLAGSNAPSNGVRRNGLDDSHIWLFSLSESGRINWRVDLGKGGGGGRIYRSGESWIGMRRVVSYVDHPFTELFRLDPANGDTTRILRLDGEVWSLPPGQSVVDHFAWRGPDSRMRILDRDFQPIVESQPLDPGSVQSWIELKGDDQRFESFYVYSSPGETWLLDDSLDVVSYIPLDYLNFYPAGRSVRAIRDRYLVMRRPDGELQLVEMRWTPWWSWWVSRYRTPLLYSAGTPLLMALLIVGTWYVRLRRRSRRELEVLSQRLELLSRDMMRKEDEHDRRIALRLHDNIGQDLTALKFAIHLASSNGDSGTTRDMGRQVDDLIERVRQVSREIRPPILRCQIKEILQHTAVEFKERYAIPCDVEVDVAVDMPEYVRAVLYRVVREALTNVVRHACASRVWIACWMDEEILICEVRDDGRGISRATVERVDAIGLAGMHERLGSIGGVLKFDQRDGGGTIVRIEIPGSSLVS